MSAGRPLEFDLIISSAKADRLSDADVAALARKLAASGEVLEPAADHADVASTGGPSSLSTLLCPLYLHALGARVAKLGVPGRPAGGVDVLATVPSYRPTLAREAVEEALRTLRHVHLAAGPPWAPMDARLFTQRQEAGAQHLPSLVIASLLAKKLALGVTSVGLDVRVARDGNFGVNVATARANARRFVAVAALLGIRAVCFLTDARTPYQPFVGRGEALQAVTSVLGGTDDGPLRTHSHDCLRMAAECLGRHPVAPSTADLRSALDACLRAHGTGIDEFVGRVREVEAEPRIEQRAQRSGVVRFDLSRLRDLLVARQLLAGTPFADPAGVVLGARPGRTVERGALLMAIRVPAREVELGRKIASCAQVGDGEELVAPSSAVLEVVSLSSGP